MATIYFSYMENALSTMFPDLSPGDVEALTWGGLEGTAAYAARVANNPSLDQHFKEVNAEYLSGLQGTGCN